MKAVIAVIAIIIVLGAGAFALTQHNDKKETTKPATTSSDSSSMNMNSSSDTSSADSSAPASTTNSVAISDFAFSPASITVKKGTTVTWTNKDSATHNVIETDGKDGPKSGDLDQGKNYSFTFNTAGTFHYRCTFHSGMTGTVTVTE